MRKIEKETLEIINTYKSEEYEHYKKLITIRENELKENLDKLLYNDINKEKIERDIEVFKRKFNFNVSVDFKLSIRSYYTDYQALYEDDKVIQGYKEENNKLKIKVNELQKENTDGLLRIQEYYEKTMNKRIEYLEAKYKTKIEEVKKICKNLENKLNTSLFDIDITTYINAYLELLDYLKEE